MNSYLHPSGATSPRQPTETEMGADDPELLMADVVTALTSGPVTGILRRNWNPDVNILSTQPITTARESAHV